MAQDYSQVNFRIPTKLKNKIEESAASNERSITSDIVARLEKSFEEDNEQKIYSKKETIHAMERLMSGIVSNAIIALLQHGVDKEIIHKIFIAKPPE